MLLLLLLSTPIVTSLEREEILPPPHPITNESLPLEVNLDVPSVIHDDSEDTLVQKDEKSVWSEWRVATPCTDSCGACGRSHLFRECLCVGEEECPCSKPESRIEVCGTVLCQFPRHTCCKGFKKIATPEGFECAAEKASSPSTVAKKKESINVSSMTKKGDVVWSEWTVATPCTDTCGACGVTNLVRDCLCAGEEGCPCRDRETRVEVCGMGLCEFPRHTCCEGFKKIATVDGFECFPDNDKIRTLNALSIASRRFVAKKAQVLNDFPKDRIKKEGNSVWSEWIVTTPCTDSCGSCGRTHLTRECLCVGKEGCPCSAPETRVDVCAKQLCEFPRHTCCEGFKKTSIVGGFECTSEDSLIPSALSIPKRDSIEKKKKELISDDSEDLKNRVKKEEDSVWGDWIVSTPCTSDCGACGRISFTRDCLCAGEEGCPCREKEMRVEVCGTDLCEFPRHTCCDGFKKISTFDGFKCSAIDVKMEERICNGRWTPWTEDSPVTECSASCGMCGKRKVATRKCEPEGCECSGETELLESCGVIPCPQGKDCCQGFVKGRVEGRVQCVTESSIPPSLTASSRKFLEKKKNDEKKEEEKNKNQLKLILPVLSSPSNCSWGEWMEIDSDCSDSCGMCGVRISARRNCEPVGCNCVGASTRYEDCGEGICEGREKQCCGYYTKSLVNGLLTCIDPVVVKEKTPIRRSLTQSRSVKRDTLSTSTCRGIWSPFIASSFSSCDSPCGLCGHRSVAERRCIPEGCTCEGSNKLYERCGEKPCWNKKDGCCEGASIVLVDGKRVCKEIH